MKRRLKTALGIEVGRDRVNLALVAPSGETPGGKVIRAASAPLPENALRDGGLADIHALTRVLRKLRRQAGIPRMKAAVALSANPLVVQLLDMPDPMPPNVGEFVNSELSQYVALSGKSVSFDFCAVAGEGSARLLSTAAERQTLQTLVRACDAAGLTVEVIEPALLACARTVQRENAASMRSSKRLIVEVSADHLAACVLRRGMLEAVRVKDFPPEANGADDRNRWLLEQIEMMMRYYGADSKDSNCDVLVFVRDGMRLTTDTFAALQRSRTTPTLTVEAPGEPRPESAGEDETPPKQAVSKVAVGLALKMFEGDKDAWRVNLLPDEVEQTRSFAKHALVAANIAALIVLGMLVALELMTHTANKKRLEIEKTKSAQKLYATQALATRADALERRVGRTRNQVQRMQDALTERRDVDWPSLLHSIRNVTPTAVCITQLSSNDAENLYLRGLAMSYEGVRTFAQGLAGRDLFESVSLAKVERPQGERALVRYQIDCKLKTTR